MLSGVLIRYESHVFGLKFRDSFLKIPVVDGWLHIECELLVRSVDFFTMAKAKKLHADSYTDWDMNDILEQFDHHNAEKNLKNVDGVFIGFVKKKIKTYRKGYA
jgi:hypothetical protein